MAEDARGRRKRAWRAIEPQLPAMHALLDNGKEAGQIHPDLWRALNAALNRFEDDYGLLVDKLDRMMQLGEWSEPAAA